MSIDLAAQFGPLKLNSPIIVGACPLTGKDLQQIAMVSNGAGALVLPSLFEEQVIVWNQRPGAGVSGDTIENEMVDRCKQILSGNNFVDVESYLRLVERSSSQVSIPVIASLNGCCLKTRWLAVVSRLADAGADAIELHVRRPLPTEFVKQSDFEDALLDTVTAIKQAVSIPLFLKLCRDQASLYPLARRLQSIVDGLVLFGRSPQFDIQLDSLRLTTEWGLTESGSITESLQSLMQVGNYFPRISVVASGGIGNSCDLVKVLLAGADGAMVTSAIYREGPPVIGSMLEGLIRFMESIHVTSLRELKAKGTHLYDPHEDRFAYINAHLSELTSDQTHRGAPESDRWGHVKTD